jgi:hypothetical protein
LFLDVGKSNKNEFRDLEKSATYIAARRRKPKFAWIAVDLSLSPQEDNGVA